MPGTLIDTCVLRELHLPRPFWRVRRAVDDLWFEDIRLSMVTFAILEGGLTELPQEFKQRRVRGWMREIRRKLGENLLGIDYETSVIWGQILTSARRRRLKLPYHDSLIAATAKRHELVVMTRNIGFFAPFSIEIFNPWAEKQDSAYDFGEEPAESFSRPGSTSAELSLPRGNAESILESLDSENEAA
ncbi:MAG: PIN domain-containing protein [Methylobacterium sp.]|jgi:predicted nucleic acid-binding protein|nr:PIN domain-containing protein [Methylobacterium sp.]MCA3597033.1 PIN domain-containing protein [Methylobacterium sp.]MCA3603799.1 PIN domain-containing protein [Methylobacterium sp.]MCA3609050.1 PIN domain-containing protein [Methylobacterium sp.]MCA3611887.1 PIN domain-containing protein [Methylobacterium sp.]